MYPKFQGLYKVLSYGVLREGLGAVGGVDWAAIHMSFEKVGKEGHPSLQLMPCTRSGIKDHSIVQSAKDVAVYYPENLLKQSADEKLEDFYVRIMRVMLGGPPRLDKLDSRQFNQEQDISCVKSSWNPFCRVPDKALNIKDALFNMNKTICRARLLANFHIMRICKEGKPLDELA